MKINKEEKIFRSRKIFLFCLGFILGIFLASFRDYFPLFLKQGEYFLLFFIFIFILFLLIFYLAKIKIFYFFILFFISSGFFLGATWLFLAVPNFDSSYIAFYNNKNILVRGFITNDPEQNQYGQKFIFRAKKIITENQDENKISGKFLVYSPKYPERKYGEALDLFCDLSIPLDQNNQPYPFYFRSKNIYSICSEISAEETPKEEQERPYIFFRIIFFFKNKAREAIQNGLNDPEAGLAEAIIFGGSRGFDEEVKKNFSQSGLTHITAVSGMNISVFSAAAWSLLLAMGLRRRPSFIFSAFLIFLYVILAGSPASAVRAGFMGFMSLAALVSGRILNPNRSLVFSAFIMLILNPFILRGDIGFQLSFLATAGIFYFYPSIRDYFENHAGKIPNFAREAVALSLSAQVLVWPLIAYNFQIISLISPLSNLAVFFVPPILMAASPLGAFFSWLLPNLAGFFMAPAGILAWYLAFIAQISAQIPFAYFNVLKFSWIFLVLYYLLAVIAFKKFYSS